MKNDKPSWRAALHHATELVGLGMAYSATELCSCLVVTWGTLTGRYYVKAGVWQRAASVPRKAHELPGITDCRTVPQHRRFKQQKVGTSA